MSSDSPIWDVLDKGWELLENGDQGGARSHFLRAIEETDDDEDAAEAHHGLGFVYQAAGDHKRMVEHWLETRRLDLQTPLPDWHLKQEAFAKVAEEALAELPPNMIERLKDVPMLIDKLPTEAQVKDGIDPRFLGLFTGVPLPEKSTIGDQSPALDTIHLYQYNLERAADDRQHLCEEIRITVLHETAHFFGLDDEDLEELGLG